MKNRKISYRSLYTNFSLQLYENQKNKGISDIKIAYPINERRSKGNLLTDIGDGNL